MRGTCIRSDTVPRIPLNRLLTSDSPTPRGPGE
jgi:hypothetical protein